MSTPAAAAIQREPLLETPFASGSLEDVRHAMAVFANERGWERFHTPVRLAQACAAARAAALQWVACVFSLQAHTPLHKPNCLPAPPPTPPPARAQRNLCLALVGEIGEVMELFQWRGECAHLLPDWSAEHRVHLGEELADCLLYLVRLSDRCGIDLAAAWQDKMAKNRRKYPAAQAFGRSDKYTAYEAGAAAGAAGAAVAGGAEGGSSAGAGSGSSSGSGSGSSGSSSSSDGGGGSRAAAPGTPVTRAPAASPKVTSPTDPSSSGGGGGGGSGSGSGSSGGSRDLTEEFHSARREAGSGGGTGAPLALACAAAAAAVALAFAAGAAYGGRRR
jgi:dCTP diphosphatase